MSDRAEELLRKLDAHLRVAHLDMSGKHKYRIDLKGHEIINEIKAYLYRRDNNDE